MESFGKKLKIARRQRGFSQQAVADVLRINRSTCSYYESGTIDPSVETIYRICRLLNVSADWMIDPARPETDERIPPFFPDPMEQKAG